MSKSPLLLLTAVISLLCFPGEPNVTLSGECRGEVKINNRHVCSTNWNLDYSHLVCQEQQHCSNAVFYQSTTSSVNTQLPHVACEDHHDKLGQCDRYEGLCANGPVSVYCVGTYRNTLVSRLVGILFSPVPFYATILAWNCIVLFSRKHQVQYHRKMWWTDQSQL